jgi:3-oxoacyl-[acyl-carrier protein] reductase
MKSIGWGRIVNITSCAGLENMGPVTYGVAKSSLTVYTRTMGRILATEGGAVVMTAVFPGVVLTEGGHWDLVLKNNPIHAEQYIKDRCPLGRFGLPSEIAPVVAFYCSELASFSHGAIIPVDAGQSRHYMSFNYLS